MNLEYFIERLETNRGVFESLVKNIGDEQAKWRPSPEKWSILEVVNHLYDEEREDFRQRLELVLKDTSQPFPKIDPRGWVTARAIQRKRTWIFAPEFSGRKGQVPSLAASA